MRHLILTYALFLLLGLSFSNAQSLIPNAGFEGGWACPESFTENPVKELIPHWKNPNKGTPDYFHRCSNEIAGVPENFAGYMPASEGDAYVGLILREVFADSMPEKKASREYLSVELHEELEFRQLYCFSLKYALAPRSRYAVDALGVSFTRERLKSWDAGLLDAEPMVFNMPGHRMDNKTEWHELCGVFRSRGREKFLSLGNFCPNVKTHYFENSDSLTDTTFVYAYYYIDDVKLYKIENQFECGCQDDHSAGYDWLDEDSQSFMEAYNNYLDQMNADERLLAENADFPLNTNTNGTDGRRNSEKEDANGDKGGNNEQENDNEALDHSGAETDDSAAESNTTSGNEEGSNTENENYSDALADNGKENNTTKSDKEKEEEDSDYASISGQLREGALGSGDEELIESLRNANTGFSIDMPNIYFAFNQSELLPSSFSALEKLANIMQEHSDLRIEIRGHTDNIGSNWYNKRLSVGRAEAVYRFLIEAGIDESRLKYRGFGNKVPVADNETEEGRQLNRRVEIKVISNE
ncbi:MAG: OmpA family protein [Bacteroidales bacterium]